METDTTIWIAGIVFGFSAGLSPGPLLTLVLSESLKHGTAAGVKVAMAPLLTDLPIVAATLLVLSRLTDHTAVLGIIAIAGGAYLVRLAYESLTYRGETTGASEGRPASIRKGVVANFLNPSPYVFWFSIGGPLVIKAFETAVLSAVWFLFSFYLLLVGSKVVVAMAVGKSRHVLSSRAYVWTNRGLGAALLVFAALFLREGARLLFFNP